MKKILILAYDFPPYVSVGGLRPYNWFRYLREFGVEPIVITRQWSNDFGNKMDYLTSSKTQDVIIEKTEYGTIIRGPYKSTISNKLILNYGENRYVLLRKLFTAFEEIGQFLLPIGAKKGLYKVADEYLKNNVVDVIIATGEPFILFSYADKLSHKYRIPWIADYRDPWSQNNGRQQNRLLRMWHPFIEKKTMNRISVITTVSDHLAEMYKAFFSGKQVHVQPNGFDPSVAEIAQKQEQVTDVLTLSFVGTLYAWHPWRNFLEVFSQVVEEQKQGLALHFYGINIPDEVAQFVSGLPQKTQDAIRIFPKMPNEALLQQIAKENVMLLFNDYAISGTKIYDYLAIRRQILFCYRNDTAALELKQQHYNMDVAGDIRPQEDILKATSSGVVVEDAAHLRTVLYDLLAEFAVKGCIACTSHDIEQFSRRRQVAKLAELVKTL